MCESSSLMPPSPSPPRPPRPPAQPLEYKHLCRVCNKGFTCGSALGGHMRAHGASDDGFGADDDSLGEKEPPARCRGLLDDQWDAVGTSATHAYALRANPNRLIRSCQVCKNCGKEFSSWELFLEHGKCNSDEEPDGGSPRSSSPPSDAADAEEDPAVAAGWSKGKRSRRVKLMAAAGDDPLPAAPSRRRTSGEEEDLANCLVMLSSSNIEPAAVAARTEQQAPCASASKEGDRGPPLLQPISFLAPAPQEPVMALPSSVTVTRYGSPPAPRGVFECKACKKVFTSHQALGGHRASHKKVKGCFAAKVESNVSEPPRHTAAAEPNNGNGKAATVDEANASANTDARTCIYTTTDGGDTNVETSGAAATLSMALAPMVHEQTTVAALTVAAPCKKNAKMHECSVCHRLFTSGQALGGHKRCHWLTSGTADLSNPVANLTVLPLTEDLVGVVRHKLLLRPMADVPAEPALDLTIAANTLPLTVRTEAGSSSFHRLDPAAPAHFQSPVVPRSNASHRNRTSSTSGHDANDVATASAAAEDEADSTTVKRARLSDLKDVVSMDGEPTEPWLQVGIGSSSAGGDDKRTRE